MECLNLAFSETKGPWEEDLDLESIFLDFLGLSCLDLFEDMMNDENRLKIRSKTSKDWKREGLKEYTW